MDEQNGHKRAIAHLADAFGDGAALGDGTGQVLLSRRRIADLIVPGGEIVACDPPLVEWSITPFTTRFAAGRYPVVLTVAHVLAYEVERVAYATLQVRETQPVRWDVANRVSHDGEVGNPSSFEVDTGTACFMDIEAAEVVRQRLKADPDFCMAHENIMEQTWAESWGWADLRLEPETAANMITFSAGAGDGAYSAYVGYDDGDKPICLTIDFQLVWPEL